MEEFGVGLDDFDSPGEAIFVSEFESFFFDLERLVVAKADDGGYGFEEGFIDGDV